MTSGLPRFRRHLEELVQFACVDGPDFDAYSVDWVELTYRRSSYLDEEVRALSEFECNLY